jgi:intracellular septation protein
MVIWRFLVSLAIEFGPVAAFFLATSWFDFYIGVAILIIATLLALFVSVYRDKRVPIFSIIASTFVVIFGIMTLVVMDPKWIVLEYTLYNALFGIVLIIGFYKKKPLLKILFTTMFHISDEGWLILSKRWGIFFIFVAISNEIVWNMYSEEVWVQFRLLATLALTIFGFSQFGVAKKHRLEGSSPWGLRKS